MPDSVFDRLIRLLEDHGARFEVTRHEAVHTSDEAARVRGTSLASGAKALICKCDDRLEMFVMPADMRLDSKRVRKQAGLRGLRFATPEEVRAATTLAPGSIPPFGSLFGMRTYCDQGLARQPTINFNAGDHSISISMPYADYLSAESPTPGRFAKV